MDEHHSPDMAAPLTAEAADALKTETLLTAGLSATGREEAASGAETETRPETPEDYALNFSEGINVNQELLGSFRATAHQLGLSRAQAQELASLYEKHVSGTEQTAVDSLKNALQQWEGQIRSAPDFSAKRDLAQRALRAHGNSELFQLLDQSCLGSHPAVFNFMASVGKALGEPAFKNWNGANSPLTIEQILYPDMA